MFSNKASVANTQNYQTLTLKLNPKRSRPSTSSKFDSNASSYPSLTT